MKTFTLSASLHATSILISNMTLLSLSVEIAYPPNTLAVISRCVLMKPNA